MKGKSNRSPSTGKGQGRGRGQTGGKGKKSRSNSPAGEKEPPCRNHLKGKCTKGDQCPFWHSPPCRFHKGCTCNAGEKCIFLHAHVAAIGQGGPEQTEQKEAKPEDSDWDPQRGPRVRGRSPVRPKKTLVVLPLACSALASPDRVASAEKKRRVIRFNARADPINYIVPSENTMWHYENEPQSAILLQKLGDMFASFRTRKA